MCACVSQCNSKSCLSETSLNFNIYETPNQRLVFTSSRGFHSYNNFIHLIMLVGWLVFQQDYTKTNKQMLTKLEWRTGLSPEKHAIFLMPIGTKEWGQGIFIKD